MKITYVARIMLAAVRVQEIHCVCLSINFHWESTVFDLYLMPYKNY